MLFHAAFIIFVIGEPIATAADETPPQVVLEATRHVQNLLRDPKLRSEANKKSQAAMDATLFLEGLGGSKETNEEIYSLAAEIFGDLVNQSKGNGEKLKRLVEEGQKNPEEFAKKLSESQKIKLRRIAEKIPIKNQKTN